MTNILERILLETRAEVERRKAQQSESALQKRLAAHKDRPRGFADALTHGHPAIIAELKQASPSKGLLCEHYEPARIATRYAEAGAHCLSVLTDEPFFKGSLAHLQEARAACTLPVLRKDFMLDPYQIYESRLVGADCVLLIAAALNDATLQQLAHTATELGMDVLIEVHSLEDLHRALQIHTPLIGINNRDLGDFSTHIETTLSLLPHIPVDRLAVSESGIHEPTQVTRLHTCGAQAFLVGEALLTGADPGAALQRLFPADSPPGQGT